MSRPVRSTLYTTLFLSGVATAAGVIVFASWARSRAAEVCTPSRGNRLISICVSLQYQVELFKLQHNDRLPGVCPLVTSGGPPHADSATFWAQMTQYSDLHGYTHPTRTERFCCGPYIQSVPINTLNGSTTIASAPGRGVGFTYDFAGGAGTGKVGGVDSSGAMYYPYTPPPLAGDDVDP